MIPIRYIDLYRASKVLPESKVRKKLQRMLLRQRQMQLHKEMRRVSNSPVTRTSYLTYSEGQATTLLYHTPEV